MSSTKCVRIQADMLAERTRQIHADDMPTAVGHAGRLQAELVALTVAILPMLACAAHRERHLVAEEIRPRFEIALRTTGAQHPLA